VPKTETPIGLIRHQAAKAKQAICAYDNLLGDESNAEMEAAITHLITGIMHCCDDSGTNFKRALRLGRFHHKIEREP